MFSGADAAAYGLVTLAVPDDEIDERVAAVCRSLATGAPQGLRESKRILNADLIARIDARGAEMAALSRAALRLRRGARGDDGVPQPEEVAEASAAARSRSPRRIAASAGSGR